MLVYSMYKRHTQHIDTKGPLKMFSSLISSLSIAQKISPVFAVEDVAGRTKKWWLESKWTHDERCGE